MCCAAQGGARICRRGMGWAGANLVATHVAGLNQAERVIDAERREDAEVALGEHGDR